MHTKLVLTYNIVCPLAHHGLLNCLTSNSGSRAQNRKYSVFIPLIQDMHLCIMLEAAVNRPV